MGLTQEQELDLLMFGNAYTEIFEDGTKRRIDPRDIRVIFNKKGEVIRTEW